MEEADPEERSPVEKLSLAILLSAVNKKATSVTIVAEESASAETGWECHVWFEVDGEWEREMQPPAKMHEPLVHALLRMAGLEPVRDGERRCHFGLSTGAGDNHYFELTVTCAKSKPPMLAIRRTASSA